MITAPATIEDYRRKYMDLYKKAQTLFEKYDPCESHMDGSCVRTRKNPSYTKRPSLRCCGGCQHHDEETGCKVVCLACKLWTCTVLDNMAYSRKEYTYEPVHLKMYEFIQKLHVLRREAEELYPRPACREDISETLEHFTELKRINEPQNHTRGERVHHVKLQSFKQRGQKETQTTWNEERRA